MKIYFAGSIRGGRRDAELYYKIVQQLKTYGEVFTEARRRQRAKRDFRAVPSN